MPSANETTISGSLGESLRPLRGCVRSAFNEDPIFLSCFFDGGAAADAIPVPPATIASPQAAIAVHLFRDQ